MKNVKKRILAMALLVVMMFSNLPASTVSAMEGGAVQNTESEHPEVDDVLESESRLNYIFVESPYVESPGTQNIVVSWGEGTEQISDMRITVQREDGATEEWACSNQSGYLYLFSREYADESGQSTYKVTDIRFVENEKEQRFSLTELEVEAEFGVNKAYDGIEDLKPLDPEDAEIVDSSVVTIDENGETTAQENVASALNAVAGQMGMTAGARTVQRAGEIVVALDPGHDNTHGGTTGFGLTEKDLTLKIANYAKAELETYEGVKVYMTRTTAACPYPGTSSGGCIEKRVQAAAKAGAKIYVSLHLNSATPSANGAEVIIPNSSWKPQLATQGRELAQKILDELAAIGLNKRPTSIYSKDTTVNEKYPDGSISDYFSVQIYAKEQGIPGIIVEHAFLSNANDTNNFLKTEAGLKKLGVADAAGIAKYLGLSKGQWVQVGDKWKYKVDGKYAVSQWMTIGGQRYYFDKDGYRVTGWQDIGGKRYFFMPEGYMWTGWVSFGDKRYFLMPDGHMMTGWISFGETRYYLGADGLMKRGWQTINGKKYYFAQSGMMQRGWQTISGRKYFFMPEGYMMTGWISFGDTKYYLNSSGEMQTGWQDIGGKRYFFMPDGHMMRGWISFGDTRYYLDSNGVMQTGRVLIDGTEYYFSSDGKLVEKRTGWQIIGGKKYYYDQNGVMQTGWQDIGGKRYFFMPEGYMMTGWISFGDTRYFLMPDGHMMTGWISFGNTRYYLGTDGVMQRGWQDIGGERYFFMPDGHMMRGWISFGDTRYYLDSNGIMQTGKVLIDGKEYYFSNDGKLVDRKIGWQTVNGKKYYYDQNGVMQTGWQDIGGKRYFFMPEGYMMTGWISFGDTRYFLMPDGHMMMGWISFGNTRYYLGTDGVMKRDWQTINGKKYYFAQSGVMQRSWQIIDGKKYFFMPEGYMMTGWISFGDTRYYLNSGGEMQTGWQDIGGKRYFFMPDGHMMRGWISFGDTRYYLDSNGIMQTGKVWIDGKEYQFSSDGKLLNNKIGWQTVGGKKYYYDQNGVMQTGWQTIDGKRYFFMPEGYMMTGWISFGDTRYYLDSNGAMQTDWTKVNGVWYYFDGSGIYIRNPKENAPSNPQYVIEGTSSVTASQLAAFYRKKGASYPTFYKDSDAPTLERFCEIYVEEAKAENIKVEIAFMQSMLETGWLRFGGQVQISQYNFAGIGALDGGAQGATFKNVREGVRAQIQHLKAYANNKSLKNPQVDPRFHLVKRGSAQYVEWLGQKENPNGYGWATGKSYGYKIIRLIKQL